MAKEDALKTYRAKRNFSITSEPAEGGETVQGTLQFVVQKHWASRLHYDFRLELNGSMKSWAVPKGPSYDPADKRMAVHVEDHPISYNQFEGTIPEKQYGAGKVIIWDKGTWLPIGDAAQAYRDGKLKFELRGRRRIHKTPGQQEAAACAQWLEQEIALVRPGALVALGATAARSLLGRAVAVTKERGQWLVRDDGLKVLVTLHPSALLRLAPEEQPRAFEEFVKDLGVAMAGPSTDAGSSSACQSA